MKIVKSLMLMLVLTGATIAGEMPQVGPAPTPSATQPQSKAVSKMAEMLVAIVQLLPLR
jgi:hypothetical protein